jgi:transposase
MNNCIGIDVGKQELVVFDGKNHRIFPNDEHLSQLHNYIKSRGKDVKIIFEPTSTYSRRLEELCITNSIPFKKVNPSIVPNLRRVENIRSKTDKSDSQLLFLYGSREDVVESAPKDNWTKSVISILNLYQIFQRNRIALQGSLDALIREPYMLEDSCNLIKEEIRRHKAMEEKMLKDAEGLVIENGREDMLQFLKSIPGIGIVTALYLLVFFFKFPDANRKQITALAGLDPIQHQSGSSVHGKPRISKQGSSLIRKILYQATLSAARYNPYMFIAKNS